MGPAAVTHAADLVVEITVENVAELVRLLGSNFYAPLFVIEEAVRKRDQFNLIHLDYAFKVDLWVLKDSPYDAVSFGRRLLGVMFDREV